MKKYTGGCQCGNIRYTLKGKPTNPHFCHCHMCQRFSGAPVVAWVDLPLSSLSYKGNKPVLYRSSKKAQRGFFPKCHSQLFALDDGSDMVCMTIATMDKPNLIKPEYDSFKESSPSWMKSIWRKGRI